MKWLDELKRERDRYDVRCANHNLTERDEEEFVDLLFNTRDRLIAIVERVERGEGYKVDKDECFLCGAYIGYDHPPHWHFPTCPYSDEWTGE